MSLAGIVPWIDCLDHAFVDYSSFNLLRVQPKYRGILTFTTPAFSDGGKLAFLEVWTEDGRFEQMGWWIWLQMRKTDAGWSLDWKRWHTMS
jgi:hypothetical protein